MTCPKHGEYEAQEKTIRGITVSAMCPVCEKEEAEAAEKERREIEAGILRASYKAANIEPMYYGATLEQIDILTPEHEKAVMYAREMIATKKGKLVLLGANGTGKTHIATVIVYALHGSIYSMYEITTRIRASYVAGAKENELEIVNQLASLPMLAIDEIGRTKGSEAETNWLSYIVDKRHVRGLPTVLISNKHVRKLCPSGGCEKCLENYISEDIMSRLAEDGRLVTFKDGDYRRKKRSI
jgi:DNA replication protein DnaC